MSTNKPVEVNATNSEKSWFLPKALTNALGSVNAPVLNKSYSNVAKTRKRLNPTAATFNPRNSSTNTPKNATRRNFRRWNMTPTPTPTPSNTNWQVVNRNGRPRRETPKTNVRPSPWSSFQRKHTSRPKMGGADPFLRVKADIAAIKTLEDALEKHVALSTLHDNINTLINDEKPLYNSYEDVETSLNVESPEFTDLMKEAIENSKHLKDTELLDVLRLLEETMRNEGFMGGARKTRRNSACKNRKHRK